MPEGMNFVTKPLVTIGLQNFHLPPLRFCSEPVFEKGLSR
jgi:hypothetical protein